MKTEISTASDQTQEYVKWLQPFDQILLTKIRITGPALNSPMHELKCHIRAPKLQKHVGAVSEPTADVQFLFNKLSAMLLAWSKPQSPTHTDKKKQKQCCWMSWMP